MTLTHSVHLSPHCLFVPIVSIPKQDYIYGMRTVRYYIAGLLIALPLLAASCATAPEPAEPPAPEVTIPETYSIYDEAAPATGRWWEEFGSAELAGLVDDALSGSLTLRQSWARLEQAKASVLTAGAGRYPDLILNAGMSESERNVDGDSVESSTRTLNVASRWELDLWGEVSAGRRAAILSVEASQDDYNASALTLASEVTLRWLEILSARQELALLAEQIEVNQTILDLVELRYLKGMANALDIYQQRQALAEVKAAVPQLEARQQTLSHQLAVLTGNPPLDGPEVTAGVFPKPGALPAAGIPADLLASRPDVRAAGLRLQAAKENITAARAGKLPSLVLTGSAGFSSDTFKDLFDDWLLSLAANLAWPLFNSGKLDAEVIRQEAIADEKLAAYSQAVLTAIREVEDALVNEAKQLEYIEALKDQLDVSTAGLREAEARYRKGLSDFLPVLTALTSTQRLERTIVRAELDRLLYRVGLYRALGRGSVEVVEGTEVSDRTGESGNRRKGDAS
jgi:NodT family efflux transporter outer membrane factor (OMF) lipoprotein